MFFSISKIDSKIIAFKSFLLETKIKYKIKNIENLEKITQIFLLEEEKKND